MTDNIEILVKLFETLKTSSDKNEESTRQLIVQQLELVNHIKNMPISDLKQALKDHAKESAQDIDTCSETITTTTTDLMKELRSMHSKVTKMLIALALIVSIATGGYFIIRATADNDTIIQKHLDKKFNELSKQISKERQDEIQKLREEMEGLHKDGSLP